MTYIVRFADTARDDLDRLFDFLLQKAETAEDCDLAQEAITAVRAAAQGHLSRTPFSFRKAATSPLRRELIIPFGSSGYVALYEIENRSSVVILAERHQLEDDYH